MQARPAIERFLASPGLGEATRRAYRFDLEPFAAWLEERRATLDDVDARHPLFDVDLVGRGTAFVDFEDEGAMHMVFGATSAPTPEPATLLLLGTALVSVAARSRRKGQNP